MEIFKFNRITFAQMYSDVVDYMTTKFQQADQIFSPASAYGQILTTILNLSQLIFYYIEDSITELNIYTAVRPRSIQGLARIAGHNPTRSIAASGALVVSYNGNPIQMYGNTVVIPNYTRLVNNATGIPYILNLTTEAARLTLTGKNGVDLTVVQGEIESQTLTGSGEDLQSFNIKPRKGSTVDNFFVNVYVNSEKWRVYDSLYDIPYEGKGVVVKTGIDSGIDIYFGNTFFGKTPGLGERIRVEYLSTVGDAGNIDQDEVPQWQWLDTGFDLQGNTVDLNQITTIGVSSLISFGSDSEPIELTKVLAPKTSRAYVLANPDSYVYFMEKFNLFSVVDAFSTFDDADINDDNVVYLFLIPDVNKRKPLNADYYSTPLNLFLLTDAEKDRIYRLIEQSGQKILTTIVKIIDPIVKRYILNVKVAIFEGYDRDLVRQQIISKTSDYFLNNRRRDKIPKSDLIAIVESVEGVDSVNVWFISEENEVFKSNPLNANLPDVGLDDFGDVIIGRGEYALIRGGWNDRNGVFFQDGIDPAKPSSINIVFGKDTENTLNIELHRINVENIKNT
jgi:hypothetical protein